MGRAEVPRSTSTSEQKTQSRSQEVHNASIAILDEDHSELSRRIAHAFLPPYFQPPQPIAERDVVPLMNAGRYTFIIDIPPNFARDVLARRQPAIQLNVDATAMAQVSPTTHFVSFAQAILYRGAGIAVVWPQFVIVALIGGLFLVLALLRFRRVAAALV